MNPDFTPSRLIAHLKYFAALLLLLCTVTVGAQVNVIGGYTAAQMAMRLAGPGVTVFNPRLTCPSNASGQFMVVSSTLGIDSGIVLTCGAAVTTSSIVGVNIINGDTAAANPGNYADNSSIALGTRGPGDADLTALVRQPTMDACVLEFDFKPAGDTIRFKYVFGSEEYNQFTCSPFNDVFGFFISGGAYTTPVNLARVPGTSVPVCINSINCGPTGTYTIGPCTALGSGAPFCAYYVDNHTGTTITYDGLTRPLEAVARVNPCDTYHLKLGIADVVDSLLDSGVFIEAGSLKSNALVGLGLSGPPYCIRGCMPATFIFSAPAYHDTPIKVRYIISGTAVNGYDYSFVADSATIPAFVNTDSVVINPLLVPATGIKTVTLTIQIPDPCQAGVYVSGATATINILDSLTLRILTPDTGICFGSVVNARALGDPVFGSMLTYAWSPSATATPASSLNPVLSPTGTTTYTLTANMPASAGCPAVSRRVTVGVFRPSFDSVTVVHPSVCGYADGKLILHGMDIGYLDTVHYTKNGVPQPPVPAGVSTGRTITISGLSAGLYNNIWVKVGNCRTGTLGPVNLVDPPPPVVTMDSSVVLTCVGVGVPLHAYVSPGGIPVSYTWSPGAFLSASTISNPVVTPGLAGDITYTVTINPGLNPACASVDTVHVHAIAPFVLNNRDTAICLGRFVFGSITGSAEMDYRWSPAAGVSDTTLQNPVLTPTVSTSYIVRGSYAHCPDQFASFYLEVDTLAHPVSIIDTICLGMSDTFNVAVPGPGTGSNYYHYQWIPSADVSNDTLPNVVIIPVTMGTHVYSVVVNPHALNCSTTGTVNIFVLPNSISVSPHDTMICKGKMVQAVGAGDPLFSYQWIPTAGIGVSNVLNALITPDTSATYVVTASFGRCPDMQDSIRLDVQPNPSVYIGGNRLFCAFDTLHINAQVDPAWYGSYAYSWTPAAGLDNTTAQTVVYSGTSTTDVYVTVTTPAGCQGKDSAHITVYPGNFAAMVPDHLDFCPHQSASLPVTTALAGVSYKWFPARYLSDSTSGNPVVSPEVTQVYTIVATTANGCRDTLNFTAIVYPAALISLPDSVVLYPGERYQLEPYTNCNSFVWAPPVGLDNPYISNPVASPGVSTRYRVEGTTINGCKTADSIDVIVDPGAVITVPNAFVPGSEVNNEFKIIRKGIATLNYFRIFNRWGNLLFETNNIDQGWNGSFKSEPQPFGVYVYEIQAVSVTGQIFTKKGNVTLLR